MGPAIPVLITAYNCVYIYYVTVPLSTRWTPWYFCLQLNNLEVISWVSWKHGLDILEIHAQLDASQADVWCTRRRGHHFGQPYSGAHLTWTQRLITGIEGRSWVSWAGLPLETCVLAHATRANIGSWHQAFGILDSLWMLWLRLRQPSELVLFICLM